MSFNLVDLVKDQVKGQLIGHMGSLLGDEGSKATGAVDSMIPALLNGMTGSANTQQGADSLFGAVQNQDDSLLDNMGNLLGGGQASTVIDNGNSVLSNLFGTGGLGKLAGALSTFSGVSRGGTSSLMGILAPIILGVLKRKVMGDGLNAGGLASLLGGQSQNISSALPQGLGDQLNSSGFLSSIGGAGAGLAAGASDAVGSARDAAGNAVGSVTEGVGNAAGSARDAAGNVAGSISDTAGNAADSVRDTAGNVAGAARDGVGGAANTVHDGARSGGSVFRWLLPLIVLAALAWAAFTFLLPGLKGGSEDAADKVSESAEATKEAAADSADAVKDTAADATDAAKDTAADATDAAKDTAADAMDAAAVDIDPDAMGNQLSGLFGSATDTLTGITDVDTAKAAIPALGDLGTEVNAMSGMMQKVPEAARGPLQGIASEGMGKLQPVIDKVMELPGVGAVLTPVMGPIMEKMQELGG